MMAVSVDGLYVAYGDTVAVEDVSFEVQEGEIFGLLGTNGAGKTTTVECLSGLRTPGRGHLTVFGLDASRRSSTLRELIGVQLQSSQLPDKLTVGEALRLYASFYPRPVAGSALLERLGLDGLRDACWSTLSGGQRQRLAIALALIGRPRLAILDELTTGLDPQARRETWQLIEGIRDEGVTVVLVSHFMEEAERLCDRIAVLDRGRVVAGGTPAEIVDRVIGSTERITFQIDPSADVSLGIVRDLPEVDRVLRDGLGVVVDGHGDVVLAVTAALARAGIAAHDLRVRQAALDDAFVALTATEEDHS
ncbi:MAG: transporter related [Frankiales bacterium]|nr:transporter related [Frankiales bacterium]